MRHPPRPFLLATAGADTLVAVAVVPMIRPPGATRRRMAESAAADQWDHGLQGSVLTSNPQSTPSSWRLVVGFCRQTCHERPLDGLRRGRRDRRLRLPSSLSGRPLRTDEARRHGHRRRHPSTAGWGALPTRVHMRPAPRASVNGVSQSDGAPWCELLNEPCPQGRRPAACAPHGRAPDQRTAPPSPS
jgi:hypothetical protein